MARKGISGEVSFAVIDEIMELFDANPFLLETAEGIALRIGRNVTEVLPAISQLCKDLGVETTDIETTDINSWEVRTKQGLHVNNDRYDDVGDETKFSNLLHENLTPREHEVMELLLHGLTYTDIANKLTISAHTVKNHVNAVYQKLDVSSRSELFSKIIMLLSQKDYS